MKTSERLSPNAAFQHRDFRLYQAARFASTLGVQIQGVAVGWQVYSITGRPLDLGYVGLAQFLPAVLFLLATGHVADRFDRRNVLIVCHVLLSLASAGLFALARSGEPSVVSIFALLALIGSARAFAGPAGQALMPNLVPPQHFQNAVAWSSSIWQVSVVAGPALGGLINDAGGARTAYGACLGLELFAIAGYSMMQPRAGAAREAPSFERLLLGLRFIRDKRLLLGAISLDLFAVLLGGAIALLPIYARDILEVGPKGLGFLRSAPALGAMLMAVLLAYRPLSLHAGATMLASVAVFGLSTIVFGLSKSFALSLTALAVGGAADMISVYIRHTLVQLNTPDEMRGRVAAANLIFIGASNELGEFESGLTAEWLGVVPSVVVGGIGTCLVVGVWTWLFPQLRRARRLEAQD
jgi:MFS family permease